MKKFILSLSIAILSTLSVNAAKWSNEAFMDHDTKLKSQALMKLVKDFRKADVNLSIDAYVDFYETTATLLYKRAEEPLRNSVKQLHHINASGWYCDVEVESDDFMSSKITRKKASQTANDLFFILDEMDVTYNASAVKIFGKDLYRSIKDNRLPFMVSEIFCNDEYGYAAILSVYDEETKELVNLSVGYSD